MSTSQERSSANASIWRRPIASILARSERIACAPGDDEESRARKTQFVAFAILIVPAAVIWAVMYYVGGEPRTGLIPLTYTLLTAGDLLILRRTHRFEFFRQTQQGMILLLPFALQTALGGFVGSSAVIVWSFLAVMSSVVYGTGREPIGWFGGFGLLILVSTVIQPGMRVSNNLPPTLVHTLFALNLATVSGIAFLTLYSFLSDRRKLRALEVAYLRQEMIMRQQEKLATLGTLAAGVAHELNNPASATRRAARHLQGALSSYERASRAVGPAVDDVDEKLAEINRRLDVKRGTSPFVSALERSDREAELEEWLEERGFDELRDDAVMFVDAGVDVAVLEELAAEFRGKDLGPMLELWVHRSSVVALTEQIRTGSARVSDIVSSLKEYSRLDQAPIQNVDLAGSLEATLQVLGGTLNDGITIHRHFDPSVPVVEAFGAELNQVWTSLLRNAGDALNGKGEIHLRTRVESGQAVVEIEDNGPGIASENLSRVFDPFFTTKPPGQGTGMGLATAFAIVRDRHRGSITVESQPGRTLFTVRLPVRREDPGT